MPSDPTDDPRADPAGDGSVDESTIDAVLAELVEAVHAHRRSLRTGDEAAIWAAFLALNRVSVRYDDLLYEVYQEVTPWDATELPPDSGPGPMPGRRDATVSRADSDSDADDDVFGPDDPVVIAVRQRRDYLVPDVHALLKAGSAARQAAWEASDPLTAQQPVTAIGEAVFELVNAAGGGLAALDVPSLSPTGGVLLVDRVEHPLALDPEGFGDPEDGDGGNGEIQDDSDPDEMGDGLPLFDVGGTARSLYRLDEIVVPADGDDFGSDIDEER